MRPDSRQTLTHILKVPVLRSILLLGLSLALVIPIAERFMAYPRFSTLLIKSTEDEAVRTARHLSTMVAGDMDVSGERLPPGFSEAVHHVVRDFGLVKLKLFSRSGRITYSTDPKDIGQINEHDYFRKVVMAGQVFTKLVQKEKKTLEGQNLKTDVVETYVPIMKDGRFVGAFEIYYDITADKSALDGLLFSSSLTLFSVSVGLLGALFLVLRRASADIQARGQTQRQLEESEEKFRSITAAAQDAIILMDGEGRIAYWNAAAEDTFGHPVEHALGRDLHELVMPQRYHAAFREGMERFRRTGQGAALGKLMEFDGVRRDGTEFPLELGVSPVRLNGQWNAIGVLRDITERKQVEQRLRLSARVIEYALEGILVTDANGVILMVNPAFTEMTGYSPGEVLGKKPNVLRSGRHDAEFYRGMWHSLKETGTWQGEVWNRRRNGEVYTEWLSISTITDREGGITHYLGIFSDITHRKVLEQRLERMAFYDALTGLSNRMLFMDHLNQALREVRRRRDGLAVLFCDLDGFKQVNDTYGHDVGDLLLQEVSRRFAVALRDEDTVARLGGDEFTVLLRGLHGTQDGTAVAERIIQSVNQPFELKGHRCTVGVSVGVCLFRGDGSDAEYLLKQADMAMYRAKRAGKNRFEVCRD